MTNFNALSIPIISKPSTTPPVGSKFIYFKPNGDFTQLDATGKETKLATQMFSKSINLSESFEVTGISDTETLTISTTEDIAKFTAGKTILITGSENGINDRAYTIESSEAPLDGTNPPTDTGNPTTELDARTILIKVVEKNLTISLGANGVLHIVKAETVEHQLNSSPVFFTVVNEDTNNFVQISPRIVDKNTLEFVPDTPIVGRLLVSVLA